MPTAAEHYQTAEMLLELASDDEIGSDPERYHVKAAAVHAMLANAGAIALGRFSSLPARDSDAWLRIAGTGAGVYEAGMHDHSGDPDYSERETSGEPISEVAEDLD